MKKQFFISTAIDYPSTTPHLGHAYEKICADIIARFKRLQGFEVHFSTGTDEHGLKIQRAAEEAGMQPQEFVDSMSGKFKEMCNELDISYNDFIRTTETRHSEAVQAVISSLQEAGDIYGGTYEGPYCIECETFYSEDELADGKCPVHQKEVERIEEECYFFRMSKYQNKILDYLKKNPGFIQPESYRREVLNRLKDPVRNLCITRKDLEWAVPFPGGEGFGLYVWVDALSNYLTTVGYPNRKFQKFWPADVHMIGKDITWHHCVIWSSILFSLGIPLPEKIIIHGFVTIQGRKLSKSRGVLVNPFKLTEKYSADALRYFVVRNISFGQDGDFSEEALQTRLNTELADVLGNFVHRVLKFIQNNFDGRVPEGEVDSEFESELREQISEVEDLLGDLKIDRALDKIMSMARRGNEYFQDSEPWKTIKDEPQEAKDCLFNCVNLVEDLCVSLYPFMPDTCERLANQMNREIESWDQARKFGIKPGHSIREPEILFEKVEVEEEPEVREKLVSIEEFQDLDIRIGEIQEVEEIEGSDKLLKLMVDVGGEIKQSVAGLKETHSFEELRGIKVPVLVNMEPSKLMGIRSECMVLAADVNGEPVLLEPEKDVEPGTKVK